MDKNATSSLTFCRVKYSDAQRDLLEALFKERKTVKREKAAEIALLLNVTPKQIQTWFQNKRAKVRRDLMRMTHQSYVLKRPSLPILDAIGNKTLDSNKLACQKSASSTSELPTKHPEHFLPLSNFHTDASAAKGVPEQNKITQYVPHIVIEQYDEGAQNGSNLHAQDYYNQHLQNSVPISYQGQDLNQWSFQPAINKETLSIPTVSSDRSFSYSSCSSPMSTISQSTWNSPGKTSSASDVSFLEELMTFDTTQESPRSFEIESMNTISTDTSNGAITTCSHQNQDVPSTVESSYTDKRFPLRDIPMHQAVNMNTNELNVSLAHVNQNMSLCTAVANNAGKFSLFPLKSNTNDNIKENYQPWCTTPYSLSKAICTVPENNSNCMNFFNQVQNNCYLGLNNFQQGYIDPAENLARM